MLQAPGIGVWVKPRLPDPLKTSPEFGQQETRLCARFGWFGRQILVWPIAALRIELSANKKGAISVTRVAETGFKG